MEKIEFCPVCYKVHGQAYNGILQLRNPSDEIILFIDGEIRKAHAEKKYCIGMVEIKNGIDYHFSSASFARGLGKKLQGRFGGELAETARLVGRSRETSKDLYRVTVLFRYPGFRKGDIVRYKGMDVKVVNFAKKAYVLDVNTNKKYSARYSDIKKIT